MTKAQNASAKPGEVAAIILAAGRSQRMGAFKPLLPFGASTIVETSIEQMRSADIQTIVVVIGEGPSAEKLEVHLRNSNVILAVNPDPFSEMSASIACGIRALPEGLGAVVINPVDHAAVPAEVVSRLVHEWKQGAHLVKPTWKQRGGHPVLIDLNFADELLNLDSRGGLKAFFSAHRAQVRRVEVNSKYIARDMDAWDDYAALHQEIFGDPAPQLPPEGDQIVVG